MREQEQRKVSFQGTIKSVHNQDLMCGDIA